MIGKKWILLIIRNLIFGQDRFSQILATNPGLSPKVLSENLQAMIGKGLIVKNHVRGNDYVYTLTPMGLALNKVLYEISIFGATFFQEEVFDSKVSDDDIINTFGNGFKLTEEEIRFHSRPKLTAREKPPSSSEDILEVS